MRKTPNEELNRKTIEEFKKAKKKPYSVLLDNIRSLNNVGSAFRTCDAFLINHLYLCGITAKPPHRDIQKTAIGATESVDWSYNNSTYETLSGLKQKGYKIIIVEQTDNAIELQDYKPDLNAHTIFVFGNEVIGVDEALLPLADACVEIPQFGTKHSLNISVSIGVVLWHAIANNNKNKNKK